MKRLDRRLGTTTALYWKFHLFCLDCGSRIPWRALIRRWWKHTACPSCEGYMELMTQGERQTINTTVHQIQITFENGTHRAQCSCGTCSSSNSQALAVLVAWCNQHIKDEIARVWDGGKK